MRNVMDEAEALEFIIALVYERCRVRLHDGKQHLIRARLGKRMRQLEIASLPEYCERLRQSGSEDEIEQVVNALTTNFTNFLREEDHFKFMVDQALPPLLERGRKRFRIWSAACASGEEPFSIGFYLAEHFPLQSGWDWQILATDISTKALDKARQSIYSEERLGTLSPEWRRRYFQKGHGDWDGHYRIKSFISERVSFRQLNLLGPYDFQDCFEVIFCRNVMIYFDRPTQEQLVRRLSQLLSPNGFLLVGHAESLTGLSVPLRCKRPSIYQKD
jgi:chemotaxis protein methyltransferase CheR